MKKYLNLRLTEVKVFHTHMYRNISSSNQEPEMCILHAIWPLILHLPFCDIQIVTDSVSFLKHSEYKKDHTFLLAFAATT